MTGGNTDDLRYDAENRLVEVKRNDSIIATFVYDGDGNRVKGTVNGTTSIYVGDYYEREGSVVRRYYYASGERLAMRVEGESNAAENGVFWMLDDHLGSSTIMAKEDGSYKAHRRYKAWGEIRDSSGTMGNNFRFTGQRLEDDLGLYFYGARWYDPALGRFTQPDTIVPDPAKPKAFDRYAYSYNNPVKYTDPTGHMPCAVCEGESFDPYDQVDWIEIRRLTKEERETVTTAVQIVVAVFCEACDYAMMFWSWSNGEFHRTDLAALAPGVSVAMVRAARKIATGEDVLRLMANTDCSFSASTLVATEDGARAISTIQVGDYVFAYDEAAGTAGIYAVTAVWAHLDHTLVSLRLEGEQIETTGEHPFYTEGRGWVPALELRVGDHVAQAGGDFGVVQDVAVEQYPQVMYNLTVETAHTYFVGDGQWLVHNSCPIFTNFEVGQAFSGAYDPVSKKFHALPSDTVAPPGGVQRRGGHGPVNEALVNETGADASQTYGFTIHYDGPNALSVSWTSRTLNRRHGSNEPSDAIKEEIMEAIRRETGYNVTSR